MVDTSTPYSMNTPPPSARDNVACLIHQPIFYRLSYTMLWAGQASAALRKVKELEVFAHLEGHPPAGSTRVRGVIDVIRGLEMQLYAPQYAQHMDSLHCQEAGDERQPERDPFGALDVLQLEIA